MFCGNTDNLVWTLGSSNITNLIMLNWLDSYRRTGGEEFLAPGEVSDFAQPAIKSPSNAMRHRKRMLPMPHKYI